MLDDCEYLSFDTIKEDWNEYEIEDGTILRIKFVMVKIVRKKISGQSNSYNYGFNSSNVIGVNSPKIHEPGERKYYSQELNDYITNTDMECKPLKEVWNEYLIKKDKTKIQVKIVVTGIKKASKFDEFGDPYYFVNTQPVFKTIPPKKTK